MDDCYLTLVPRGLHYVFEERLQQEFRSSGYRVAVKFVGECSPAEEASRIERLQYLILNRKKKRTPALSSPEVVGTINDPVDGTHSSLGYHKGTSQQIWSSPGDMIVWAQFITDAPAEFVSSVRCIGALLACVHCSDTDVLLDSKQKLPEAAQHLKALLGSKEYPFQKAVQLWRKHVDCAWPQEAQVDSVETLSYRISCMRSNSKRYSYTRENFIRAMVDTLVPEPNSWSVDMKNFNVEVVLLVHANHCAVGLSLRPYQYLDTKSWADGNLPPDVTPPYLSGSILSGLVRLRPATATLLWHLAQIEPGEVVLDPCAGIGTIPLECPDGVVALGGDICLTTEVLGSVASEYCTQVRARRPTCTAGLVASDAACLPLRSNSVDVIISDLPFGQRCLSSAKLIGLMPLLMGEVGRVLQPLTGRMIVLCGAWNTLLEALEELNKVQPGTWDLPCQSIFPVNIGGLVAWVLMVQRGAAQGKRVATHSQQVKRLARKRHIIDSHNAKQDSKPTKEGESKKYRRLQAM